MSSYSPSRSFNVWLSSCLTSAYLVDISASLTSKSLFSASSCLAWRSCFSLSISNERTLLLEMLYFSIAALRSCSLESTCCSSMSTLRFRVSTADASWSLSCFLALCYCEFAVYVFYPFLCTFNVTLKQRNFIVEVVNGSFLFRQLRFDILDLDLCILRTRQVSICFNTQLL